MSHLSPPVDRPADERKLSDGSWFVADDALIDIATTCSNRGVAFSAEMALRKRYPSKVRLKSRKEAPCPK